MSQKHKGSGARDIAQRLEALIALLKNMDLFQRPTWWLTCLCNSSFRLARAMS